MHHIKVTPYYVRMRYSDGIEYDYYFDTWGEMAHFISRHVAFNDLNDEEVTMTVIRAKDDELEYYSWLPDMEIRFVNKNNREEILWDAFYPEWEH